MCEYRDTFQFRVGRVKVALQIPDEDFVRVSPSAEFIFFLKITF